MVSFRTPISPMEKNKFSHFENPSKKRKLEQGEEKLKPPKLESAAPTFYVELHLEKPLPLEWQQCLDLQSGEIHFYNTRTKKRTCKDPRDSPEPLNTLPMSLELELNLPYQSVTNKQTDDQKNQKSGVSRKNSACMLTGSGIPGRSPSWVAFNKGQQEMVATACMRCHMLVMICKASPTCPNCKFVHPIDQKDTSDLLKTRLSLLCCED